MLDIYFHHCKNSGEQWSRALLLKMWFTDWRYYHLWTFRNTQSQIHFRPTELKPFNTFCQVINTGLRYILSLPDLRFSKGPQSSSVPKPLFPINSPANPRNELTRIHHLAELSSQFWFLILALGEPYLHSGYILVAKVDTGDWLANTAGLSPAPHPTSKSLTTYSHSNLLLLRHSHLFTT